MTQRVVEPEREFSTARSTSCLASIHPDGRMGSARHRPRRRQLSVRRGWKPLPRWRRIAVVQRPRPQPSETQPRARAPGAQARALDVPRTHARTGDSSRGRARRSGAGWPDARVLLGLWLLVGRPAKQRFLRLGDAYHGDTLGAVGVGGIDLFHRIFGPLLVRSIAIPSPAGTDGSSSLAAVEAALARADDIAAFIIEPLIQGAAGMLVHPPGYLRAVAELCRRHEVHLIVDEVATGFGRTGTVFACEQEGVGPDFL